MFRLFQIFTLSTAFALVGCASIIKGTTQDVAVNTSGTSGAQCNLSSEGIGQQSVMTPGTLTLIRRKQDIDVVCRKSGFDDAHATVKSGVEPWTWGNIVFGGLIGWAIDAGDGAWNKYEAPVSVVMTPSPVMTAPEANQLPSVAPQAGIPTTTTSSYTTTTTTHYPTSQTSYGQMPPVSQTQNTQTVLPLTQ